MQYRVVVTGMGTVSPVGLDVASTWAALVAGRSGVDYITCFDTSDHTTKIAAEVKGFDPAQYMDRKEARRTDRYAQLAMAAAMQALQSSGLKVDSGNADDVGVVIGSGIGGIHSLSEGFKTLFERGPQRLSPFLVTMLLNSMAAGQVAIQFGLRGPNMAAVAACATGNHAIGEAFHYIQRGDAVAMLAGGAEAPITPIGIGAFNVMRAISTRNHEPTRASRPFDAQRDGVVIGEAGAVLVLEEYEHAKARGANMLAEVVGFGASADATHITVPAEGGAGAVLAIRRALRKAEMTPDDIGYINAHGTSTHLNDRAETQAIKTVFGEHAYRVPISATKSMVGHLLGAAGALEAIVCVKTLNTCIIHPTINLDYPDPECDLDYVPHVARRVEVRAVLSNSLGFGGQNSALIFRKIDGK